MAEGIDCEICNKEATRKIYRITNNGCAYFCVTHAVLAKKILKALGLSNLYAEGWVLPS